MSRFTDGQTLKDWRARRVEMRKPMTQERAAEALGISLSHVKAIEQGRARLTPTLRLLMAELEKPQRLERAVV